MNRYTLPLLVLFSIGIAGDRVNCMQNCGQGCGMQWNGSPNSIEYTVEFKSGLFGSNPLTEQEKSAFTDAVRVAGGNWSYEFARRQSSVRANYKSGTRDNANQVRVYVTDAESGDSAHYDSNTKDITVSPEFVRGSFANGHKIGVAMHEQGHAMGSSGANCNGSSVMAPQTQNDWRAYFTACDQEKLNALLGPPRTDDDGDGYYWEEDDCDDSDPLAYPGASTECTDTYVRTGDRNCDGWIDSETEGTCPNSPIVIDLNGDGIRLTPLSDGVLFDLDGDGVPGQIPWIARDSDDAWLALDRNGNGRVDSGLELFGNFTIQPPSAVLNGFAALAMFDKPEEGGNGDGWIDAQDAVFGSLRLWQDSNHNGVSEVSELLSPQVAGVSRISLRYQEVGRRDEFGNWFRFRSRVVGVAAGSVGPTAYDVFLGGLPRRGRKAP